jgi:hypothetical protein
VNVVATFFAAIGLALVITAAVRPGTQTAKVINAMAEGGATLAEAALGQKP